MLSSLITGNGFFAGMFYLDISNVVSPNFKLETFFSMSINCFLSVKNINKTVTDQIKEDKAGGGKIFNHKVQNTKTHSGWSLAHLR